VKKILLSLPMNNSGMIQTQVNGMSAMGFWKNFLSLTMVPEEEIFFTYGLMPRIIVAKLDLP
jgi:hypothetical protein